MKQSTVTPLSSLPVSVRNIARSCKGRWSVRSEDLLAAGLGDAVGKGELEVRGQQLLDVRASDVLGLLNLNNLQDLPLVSKFPSNQNSISHTWICRKRER